MTRQSYDAEFKAQAAECARQKTKWVYLMAEELNVLRKMWHG